MHLNYVNVSLLSDGTRTVAEVTYDRDREPVVVRAHGSAGVCPGDRPDYQVGEDLAVARALRNLAGRLERQASGASKHEEDCREHARQIEHAKAEAAVLPEPAEKALAPLRQLLHPQYAD